MFTSGISKNSGWFHESFQRTESNSKLQRVTRAELRNCLDIRTRIILVIVHPDQPRIPLDHIYLELIPEPSLLAIVPESKTELENFIQHMLMIDNLATNRPVHSQPFLVTEFYLLRTHVALLE